MEFPRCFLEGEADGSRRSAFFSNLGGSDPTRDVPRPRRRFEHSPGSVGIVWGRGSGRASVKKSIDHPQLCVLAASREIRDAVRMDGGDDEGAGGGLTWKTTDRH